MTTPIAIKRWFRHHTRATIIIQPASRRAPSLVPVDGPELLAWVENVKTTDPLVLDIRRLVQNGGTPSAFQWRILRRARADAEAARYRYGNHRKDRFEQRVFRHQAAVAARSNDAGGNGQQTEEHDT